MPGASTPTWKQKINSWNYNMSFSHFQKSRETVVSYIGLLQFHEFPKVIYPKESKHRLSPVAHTIDFMCSKILNHGLNHGLLFSLFKFLGWKNNLNQLENSGLKSRFLFCLIFQFYLMYRLICQKPAHFCLPKWLWWAPFFKCL